MTKADDLEKRRSAIRALGSRHRRVTHLGENRPAKTAMWPAFVRLFSLVAACAVSTPAWAQTETPPIVANAPKVRIEHIVIHAREIEGNLLATSPDRSVIVILPPSYDRQPRRRYPVVYALHGFASTAQRWLDQLHAPDSIEAAFAKGTPEMILVFPSSENAYGGAFYSNSPVTGNFENFIADELVDYVDRHYRSIARPASRGLTGHSMGGYGAARIGMHRAERFGALYMMSPCCLAPVGTQGLTSKEFAAIAAMRSPADAAGAEFRLQGPLATAAAWAPNPAAPPMFVDLATDDKGQPRADILAKRAANAPLAFVDQYIGLLRRYRAIGMDVGDKDSIVTDLTKMSNVLKAYGIAHQFEVFSGTHTSRVAFRFEDYVLPFFGRSLQSK